MVNYVKSEWYRVTHSRELYLITAILSALVLAFNVILTLFDRFTPNFPYATVNFSVNMLIGSLPVILVVGAVMAWFLYANDRTYGIAKNAVAYGISRENLFLGKIVVCVGACIISLLVVAAVYIGSACALLHGPAAAPVREFLCAIGASMLSAVAAVILGICLLQFCERQAAAVFWWVIIIATAPTAFSLLGLKLEVLGRMASWMPWNFLRREVTANMRGSSGLWDTPEGLMKCIVAGVAGIAIFTAAGIMLNRKKEM